MNHRNAGLALELLSPLFFLQLPPILLPTRGWSPSCNLLFSI